MFTLGFDASRLLLLVGPLGLGRIAGVAELAAERPRGTSPAPSRAPRPGTSAVLALNGLLRASGPRPRSPRPSPDRRRCRARPAAARAAASVRVERRLEDGSEPVVVGLRDRVVAVVVTLGAADGQAQQRRADDLERVGHDLVGRQRLVGAAGRRPVGGHPQEARGGQQLDLLRRQVGPGARDQLVAGQLLDDEPIERLVGVEGADDVVAILVGIGSRRVVVAVAVGVGVAGDVEPVSRPALAVAGARRAAGRSSVRRHPAADRRGTRRSARDDGGRPVRSKAARRISVGRSASGRTTAPLAAASPGGMRRSASGPARSPGATAGGVGAADRLKGPEGALLGRDVDARAAGSRARRGASGAPAAIQRSMTAICSGGTFFSPGGISPSWIRSSRRLSSGSPGDQRRPASCPPCRANRFSRRSSFPFSSAPPPWQSRQYALKIGRTCCSNVVAGTSPARAVIVEPETRMRAAQTVQRKACISSSSILAFSSSRPGCRWRVCHRPFR